MKNIYLNGIKQIDIWKYKTTSDDPQIIFDFKKKKGFYLLRYKINFEKYTSGSYSQIYWDFFKNFHEENSIKNYIKSQTYYWIPIYLEEDSFLRFDPISSSNTEIELIYKLLEIDEESFKKFCKGLLLDAKADLDQIRDFDTLEVFHFLVKFLNKIEIHPNQNYPFWMEEYLDNIYKENSNNAIDNNQSPLISIILPTFNTNHKFLEDCINSVKNQSYTNWELCISDDYSTDKEVRLIIKKFSEQDKRIKYHFRKSNGHISASSNDALSLSNGDYITLLDHDDLLHKHALFFVAKAIIDNNYPNLIYSDEDKFSDKKGRHFPHFKSDFNEDLFYFYNYISHLGVYKKSIIDEIGGFRIGFEGSQDYDLALRVIAHSELNQIIHIPIVLYHWRVHSESTAASADNKGYTTNRSLKALEEYFLNNFQLDYGLPEVSIIRENRFRVIWPLPEKEPSVDLIIPTKDKVDVLSVAVKSILEKTNYQNYKITIVDNQSSEKETFEFFDEYRSRYGSKIRVIKYDKEFNYSAINNFAVKESDSEIIGLINNDIEVINSDWLREMVSHAYREDVGCVGAKLYYENNTIQHAGVITGLGGVAGHSHKYFSRESYGYFERLSACQQLSAVTAACLLVKRKLYEKVGGLNEENLKVAFNDVDFCLKIDKEGYRNIFTPFAELYHYESISRGSEDTPEKIERFGNEIKYMIDKWNDKFNTERVKTCRFYNPNLTIKHENFSIEFNFHILNNRLIGEVSK